MQEILGLDIGSYSVKAVVIQDDYNSNTLLEVFEQKIEPKADETTKQATITALKEVISRISVTPNQVYAAYGCQQTIMQNFEYHNVKRSHIHVLLANEFDSQGLFPIADCAIEYQTVTYRPNFRSLIGILMKKAEVKDFLDIISYAPCPVRIVDIDCFAHLNFYQFLILSQNTKSAATGFVYKKKQPFGFLRKWLLKKSQNEPLAPAEKHLILDIGHKKTTFFIVEKNKILFVRTIHIAGFYFTSCLQNELGMSFEQAEHIKHTLSINPENAIGEKANAILSRCALELCQEMKRTLQSLNAKESFDIKHIYMTGGSTQWDGFKKLVEMQMEIPTTPFEPRNRNLTLRTQDDVSYAVFAQAIAVGLRGNHHPMNSRLNIRHGDLSLVSDYQELIEKILGYTKIAAIILVCLLGSYFIRSWLYQREVDSIKNDYKKEVTALFGNEPRELRLVSGQKDWDFNQYATSALRLVKQTMQEKTEIVKDLRENINPLTLNILNAVSLAVPKTIYFEVVEFKIQDNNLLISADTKDKQSIDAIVEKLKTINMLSHVEKTAQDQKAGEGVLRFSVSARVNNPAQGGT